MTPRLVVLCFRGKTEQFRREADAMRLQAWFTAALTRAERLPAAESLLSSHRSQPAMQSPEEQWAIFQGMAARGARRVN